VAAGEQSPSAYALLLDREGFIIGGPEFVMTQDEGSASETDRLRVYGKRWHVAEDPAFLDALLTTPQHRYLQIEGRERLVVNRPTQSLSALREMGWSLILVRDAAEALADLSDVRQRVLWVALLVSLVIMLISLIFARTIGAPIRKLSAWAEDIAAGRLDHDITVCGRDEIGGLARSLDNMRVELKRSIDEIRDAKDRYQAVLSSIDCVVWEADIHPFRLSLVSGKVEHVLGFSAEGVRAQVSNWRQWVHTDHHQQMAETFLQIVANVADSWVEFRAKHANGEWVWLKAFVSVVVQDGRVVGLRGVMVDISDLFKASEDMQKARDLAIATAEN
jgi:PAS domain S-box-containing protein